MNRQRVIFVYNGDSGIPAMLMDAVKKALGREDCALCEIVYSPVGKRPSWRACQARLGIDVEEMHRDTIPPSWGLALDEIPCVLAPAVDGARPAVLVTRAELDGCRGSTGALEALISSRMR